MVAATKDEPIKANCCKCSAVQSTFAPKSSTTVPVASMLGMIERVRNGEFPAGSKVRGRFRLLSAEDKGGGRWLIKPELTIEIEGGDKPALIAEWLGMQVIAA